MSVHHGNRVHDPRHRLRVGVNIRRRNIPIGPDDRSNLESIASGEPFEFVLRQTLWIANHASLAAAVRDVDGGALPGHPRRQGLHLIEGYVWVIANAALGRAARDVVLHAIAFKDFGLAAVHSHRNRDYELALRAAQNVSQRLFQFQIIRRAIKLLLGNFKRIEFLFGGNCRHCCGHDYSSWKVSCRAAIS